MQTCDPRLPAGAVLVADDNNAMRDLLVALCRERGLAVIECANGLEAVRAFHRHQPDLVLMDLVMPGMEGLEATKCIRSQAPGARILIVTDYEGEALRQAACEAGAIALVAKDNLEAISQQLQLLHHAPSA